MTTTTHAPTRGKTTYRRLFTVGEFLYMIETGVFQPDERVELVEGQIIAMSPIGNAHLGTVAKLTMVFAGQLAHSHVVLVQSPVHLSEQSRPQPDLTILAGRADFYTTTAPTPADIQLVIEVSDSTLALDRKEKKAMYARAGIQEYWIVNLQAGQLEIYTEPNNGSYKQTRITRRGDSITPVALPNLTLAVADLLV